MIKRFLSSLIALVLVFSALSSVVFADHVEISEFSYVIPTAQAGVSDEPLITVGTISDVHVDYGIQGVDPFVRQAYKTALNALKAEGIDVLLVGGDMTSDNEDGGGNMRWDKKVYDNVISQFKTYSTAASTTGKTLWACGNHDYEVGMLTGSYGEGDYSSYYGFVEMMVQTNGQPISKYTYAEDGSKTDAIKNDWLGAHYNVKGFDFIIINARTWQTYSAGTLSWLDRTLSGIGVDKTVFVMGHYPLQDNRGVTNPSSYGIAGDALAAFKAVMNKYNNAIYLYGHNHGAANGNNPWIASDVFERITHYDNAGNAVNSRMVAPTSFITAFMGSSGYYNGSLTAADPDIIQAMTITVYANRIEFKMINCGVKNGGIQEPFVYTVMRDVATGTNTGATNISELYTIPSDITKAEGTQWAKDNFALYYMDMTDSVLKNDWKQGSSYVNISGGHSKGTFDKRSESAIRVWPEDGKSAVIQFTAPKDGTYKFEAPVLSYAKSGDGAGNKQVVFSVIKDGVILDITQPNNKDDYTDVLSGTVKLKKGETILFVADNYVRLFKSTINDTTDRRSNGGYLAAYYMDLSVALIGGIGTVESTTTYNYDGAGLNFAEGSFSLKTNTNFSVVAIDRAGKKLLTAEYGKTGDLGSAIYKGSNGNVTIAYRNASGELVYGPFGSGNSGKNVAAAIAFTSPADGTYNLTALLNHECDYVSSTGKNTSVVYEILDKNFNVIFSGSTANLYTAGDVEDTLSRAAANLFIKKGDTVYLSFAAASEANDTASENMGMKVESLSVTMLSAGCPHNYSDGTCTLCGKNCTHNYSNGSCTECGKACEHKWKNSKCTVCGKNCTHSWKEGKCTLCKATCSHKWSNSVCTTCGAPCTHSYGDDHICDKCGFVTVPNVTNPPGMNPPGQTNGNTTEPDSTTPDTTTKPDDTTVPEDSKPADKGNGSVDPAIVITVVAVILIIAGGIVSIVIIKKKAK